ncbi:MAG: hypothetical protein HYV03_07250 [Deltaproteobacteria bacterium]|nr:hypothetical protein [Deltaproteobacteria bacterium]
MSIFQNLLLLGRPASGKSEFIDFLKGVPTAERAEKYHIGSFEELDDFPWLWQKFMEDNLWEAAGHNRRYSSGGENPGLKQEGAPLFDFCIEKFNVEYQQKYAANPAFYNANTLFIEFSRGGEVAYGRALNRLSPEILKQSAIVFILVSYEESCRRNDARYNEKLQHSILAHKVPDATMKLFYRTHDWLELTNGKSDGHLTINDVRVPFVTVRNEPEVTDPVLLKQRYAPALGKLWELQNGRV